MTLPIAPGFYPVWLEDADTAERLVLGARDGNADVPVAIQAVNLPGPDIRDAVTNRVNAPGTNDQTRYSGASGPTIELTILPGAEAHLVEDRLREWMDPARRVWLVVQRNGWPEPRRILVRGDQFGAPTTRPGPTIAMLLPWRAPNGVIESLDAELVTIYPTSDATSGMSFPVVLPMSFGSGSVDGAGLIRITEGLATPPVLRIYGPVTAPALTNRTTGDAIVFSAGFSIPNGEYVAIDVDAGTVTANDDPDVTRYGSIDWSSTDLWLLQPGDNLISLTGTGMSAITQATVSYRTRRP
jgi:tail protein